MQNVAHPNKFENLRTKYPVFTYNGYTFHFAEDVLHIQFSFCLGTEVVFNPALTIDFGGQAYSKPPTAALENMAFHLGMIELISYWKATCSPKVLIKPYVLSPEQQKWWKKLYFHGLGEFFYLNQINTTPDAFLNFEFGEDAVGSTKPFSVDTKDAYLVPVGGGKDSNVSLSLLQGQDCMVYAINPRGAIKDSIRVAGLENKACFAKRSIDPKLLELNNKGFLNGHTPFSSMLAFNTLLVAAATGRKYVALSNEASANEPTIPGTKINHQYSKSYEFESDFRWYVSNFICPDIEYFSLLRPLNEFQIAALLCQNKQFLPVFKSCNVGSKTDAWCCNCSKCLFTFIMLGPFLSEEELLEVFGENLLDNQGLLFTLLQLSGVSAEKPFECVGTIEEVRAALTYSIQQKMHLPLPLLLREFQEVFNIQLSPKPAALISEWNSEHFLTLKQQNILKTALKKIEINDEA